VHYQLNNLDSIFHQRYAGFATAPQDWWALVELLSPSLMDTLQGTLQTVHEQMKPATWLLDQVMLETLRALIAGGPGNVWLSQMQALATAQNIEEGRKTRQLLAASINAQNIAHAHEANLKLYSERLIHDVLENSQVPVVAYTGAGGRGKLGTY
jgi:hypothetical protein